MESTQIKYAGFWMRVAANIIDTIWLTVIMYGPLFLVYGFDLLEPEGSAYLILYIFVQWVLPAIIVIALWMKYQATPGKLVCGIKVVNAKTFQKASVYGYTGRYLAYFISMIPLFLGFLWVGWDKKKRGFHDMLSRTVVIYSSSSQSQPASVDV